MELGSMRKICMAVIRYRMMAFVICSIGLRWLGIAGGMVVHQDGLVTDALHAFKADANVKELAYKLLHSPLAPGRHAG
jgi:hypothetical protein